MFCTDRLLLPGRNLTDQNESSVNGAEFHPQNQNFEPPRLHYHNSIGLTHGSKILVSLLVVVISVNVLCRSIRDKMIFNQSDTKPQPLKLVT